VLLVKFGTKSQRIKFPDSYRIRYLCWQARQITPPPINGIPFVKTPETPHKFDIYSTPSSSPVEINQQSYATILDNKDPILNKLPTNASLRHLDEFSEDSPNQSDDEAILTECIQSAMPKVVSISP